MYHCSIHPDKNAVGYCAICRKFYCEDCAEKDRGFYYCPVHHQYLPSKPPLIPQELKPARQSNPVPKEFLISHFVKGAVDDLDQQEILNSSYEGHHLVVGVPGSGKTLLSMMRAKLAPFNKSRVLLLVYNRPLKQLFSLENETEDDVYQIGTFHSWFYGYYKEIVGARPPEIQPYQYDWERVFVDLSRKGIHQYYEYVVVDEAQDFPLELLLLLRFVAKRVVIFIDPNQSTINTIDGHIEKLCKALEIRSENIHHLTKNYRSTPEIHQFAQNFFLGNYPKGASCFSSRRGRKPLVYRQFSWDETWDEVANYVEDNPGHKVGVILSRISFGNRALIELSGRLPGRRVCLYKWVRNYKGEPLDLFSDVVIMSMNTVKGLGFDAVFIVKLNSQQMQIGSETDLVGMNKFYMACTRAKKFLGVFCDADTRGIRGFFQKGEFDLLP